MSLKYKLIVNKSYEFEFAKEDLIALDIHEISNKEYHVLFENRSQEAKVISSDFLKKSYVISIGSTHYSIVIQNDLDQLITKMGFSMSSAKHINKVLAPMPGLILDVKVTEGQEVNENEALLVLEAMKMENVINAPRDGKIKKITAVKGEAVEKNNLLIEFE